MTFFLSSRNKMYLKLNILPKLGNLASLRQNVFVVTEIILANTIKIYIFYSFPNNNLGNRVEFAVTEIDE